MRSLILVCALGAAAAQYGGSAPSYPSAPAPSGPAPSVIIPWIPHHRRDSYSRSDSRSWSRSRSRSDSREKKSKCHDCRKLKSFRDGISTLVAPKISYLTDKKDCVQAVIRCPFDNRNYTLYVGNDINDNEAISTGFFIERVVKCSRKGTWQTSDDYRFKYAGCQDNGVSGATPTPAACTACKAGQIKLLPDPADTTNGHSPTAVEGDPQGGCSTLVISCSAINGNSLSALTFQDGLGGPPLGNPVTATVVCNGQDWTYTAEGVTTPITEAFCLG